MREEDVVRLSVFHRRLLQGVMVHVDEFSASVNGSEGSVLGGDRNLRGRLEAFGRCVGGICAMRVGEVRDGLGDCRGDGCIEVFLYAMCNRALLLRLQLVLVIALVLVALSEKGNVRRSTLLTLFCSFMHTDVLHALCMFYQIITYT